MHYLGCDVSKTKLDFCLLKPQAHDELSACARSESKNKTVANTEEGLLELARWLTRNGVMDLADVHVAMEGTGVYHHTAAFGLTKLGLLVSVCNPAQTKSFGKGMGIRNKNDTIDSFVLASFCRNVKPRKWKQPSPEAHSLKMLISRLNTLIDELGREKNRSEKAAATHTPETVLQSINDSIQFITQQIKNIQITIDNHIESNASLKEDMLLLISIPAIGKRVGAAILSVLHCNSFDTAEQFAAFLGLVPIERQSGGSVLAKPRMSRQGPPRIKALLYMASVCAIRKKNGNSVARELYERLLKKGKAKKAALGAVMKKLALFCFGVLRTRTPFRVTHTDCDSKGGQQ